MSESPEKVKIIIDSREQMPYSFDENNNIETIRRKLPSGDYSLDGWDYEIAVERKELNDYVQTIINDRDRFRRELTALQNYRAACIVVEGNLSDITGHSYTSGANENAVFGATTSIIVDWEIPVFFASSRQIAREFTEQFLIRWHQRLSK